MSNLIISQNKEKVNRWVEEWIKKEENRSVNLFNNMDVVTLDNEDKEISTKDIRGIISQTSSKPRALKNKYVIIYNFNRANRQAQNAFLKTLEESPVKIVLHAKTTNTLLDTIISRVKVLYLKEEGSKPDTKILKTLKDIVENKKISKIKDLAKVKDEEQLLNTLEYFLKNNKNIKAIKAFYEYKKRKEQVPLNKELQLTAILINYF